MITLEQIRTKLIEELNNAPISNAEICRKVGITTGAIAQYKSGRAMPNLETLANICKVIDVSPAIILCFEEYDGAKQYNEEFTYTDGTHTIKHQRR